MIARLIIEVLLVWTLVSQVLMPGCMGRPLFPMFLRRRSARLQDQLEHARQDLDEDDVEEAVIRLRLAHAARQKEKEGNANSDQ